MIAVRVEEAKHKKRNKKRKRYIFRISVLIVLVAAVAYALVQNFNKDKDIHEVGDEAPNFELTQVSDNENEKGDKLRLSDLEGKGVMLNFWATYCEPCEREMPYMEKLYPEYEDDIEIVAVSLDSSELVIDRFIDKHDLTFPVVHDTNSEVMDLYNISPLPSTIFIDPEGNIVDKVNGELSLETLEEHFKEIQPK